MTSPARLASVRSLAVSGATVSYRASGASADGAPALVLIHGWGCSAADWDGLTGHLPPGRRVIAVDLPGHGASTTTAPAVSIGDYAGQVAAVLDAEGLAAAVAVGHSLGGAVALELAGRRPELVSRVVGMDTYHYLQVYPAQAEAAIEELMGGFRADLDAGVDALIALSSIPSTPPAVQEHVKRSTLSAQYPLVLTALESGLRWDLDAALAAARAPVSAIIAAELADPVALERYRDRIAFHPVPGVSHYLLLEDPEATAAALAAVLAG
ncbi:MAG TPA: alpha/beta fold hydrolase [Trebonia sp.]|nr:alpha/beta fold hydrolase [Trebonia sp.]